MEIMLLADGTVRVTEMTLTFRKLVETVARCIRQKVTSNCIGLLFFHRPK